MLRRPQIYYFGRLNLIAVFQNKKTFLHKGLNTKEYLTIRDFIWGLFDVEEFSDQSGDYFTGYLAKYKHLTEEEIANEEIHRITREEAAKRIAAKSRFFLHVESGLIAYHPVGRKIMRHQFCNNFCELFQKGHDNFFVKAEIQSIDEKYRILDVIRKLERITKVSFYLHPSNPSPGIWKDVDDRLKDLNASSYHEQYLGTESGPLNILDDDDFNNKLNMAVDGYGEADITGTLDGQEKVISTHDNPVCARSAHEDKDPSNVFQDLRKTINDIFKRFIG